MEAATIIYFFKIIYSVYISSDLSKNFYVTSMTALAWLIIIEKKKCMKAIFCHFDAQ